MSTEEVKALVEELRYGAEYGCDADLIERAADAIEELVADLGDADAMTEMWMRKYEVLQAQLPKRGEWLTTKYYTWECSVCGKNPTTGMGYVQTRKALYNYCPNCRAKMEPPKEDA